jgi:hypothetical protein
MCIIIKTNIYFIYINIILEYIFFIFCLNTWKVYSILYYYKKL